MAQPIKRMMTTLHDYITVLSQLGGGTTLTLAPRRRPPTSSNLINEQTFGDEEWIRRQEVAVGIPEIARRYIVECSAEEDPTEIEVPAGFAPVTICNAMLHQW